MKMQVVVMPKKTVLDPQGVAVRDALHEIGLDGVRGVRVGKIVEIEFQSPPPPAELDRICRDLLSNPVVEEYTVLP
jgi:phosphoribosylformylglycinamidine synthase subunit PurS